MSNNNEFWGNKFGAETVAKGRVFPVKQLSSGVSISGPHQIPPEPNSPRAKQADADKKSFAKNGRPYFIINARGKKVSGPHWDNKK